MAFALTILDSPIAGDDPCGPDLEATGDPDFFNFISNADVWTPRSFFAFKADPGDFDAEDILDEAARLLSRTRDVRVLVTAAKAAILGGDINCFAGIVDGIDRVLRDHWEQVKPRVDETGDAAFRIAPLFNLDDAASIVFPLQFAPLASVTRVGVATYRAHQLATGEKQPRDGETADAEQLARVLAECDLDALVATRDAVATIKRALAGIERTIVEHVGYEALFDLKALTPVIDAMLAFVDDAVTRRDSSRSIAAGSGDADGDAPDVPAEDATAIAAAPVDAGPAVPVGPIADLGQAASALDAVLAYYRSFEPSSPAIPLIEQARASLGKSLFEVIAMLIPEHAATARIHVGGEPAFIVPLADGKGAGSAAPSNEAEREPVRSRKEATALLDQVSQYFRQAEPSSPVPLLIDRARALGSRDFLSLLKDLLPEEALKTMKVGK